MQQPLTVRSGTLLAPHLDYIVLDGSGSMMGKWRQTLAAIEQYRKTLTDANAASHLILSVLGSHDCAAIHYDGKAGDTQSLPFFEAEFSGTPLYDAINSMARHIRELNPTRATILICTDGMENESKYTTAENAKALLDWLRAKGYQVIFFGCDFNNSLQAKELGANPDKAIGVQKELLKDGAKLLANKRIRYGLYGEEIHFTTTEQTQFGGLLSPPK
jgi:hypothetical protein